MQFALQRLEHVGLTVERTIRLGVSVAVALLCVTCAREAQEPSNPPIGSASGVPVPGASDPSGLETLQIATVNSVPVSIQEFNRRYKAHLQRLRENRARVHPEQVVQLKYQIPANLIDKHLVREAARRQGIRVDDKAVDKLADTFASAEMFHRQVYKRAEGFRRGSYPVNVGSVKPDV